VSAISSSRISGSNHLRHRKSALFDEFALSLVGLRPPRRNLSNNLSATVAMILMEPASGADWAGGAAAGAQFAQFTPRIAFEI